MRSTKSNDRKLIDRLRSKESFGRLLGFVGSTFEMNVDFFETDFLPTLLGMGAWDDRKWSSRIALERKLAELDAATLFQDTNPYRGRPRSLRIETVPVYLPGMSILHSKFFLAVYENAVRVLVGSANLTEQGYRKNLETIAVLTASADEPGQAHLIRHSLIGAQTYLARWLTPAAERLLQDSVAKVSAWVAPPETDRDWVVWSGGKESRLWESFLAKWPEDRTVTEVKVVSPFWSEEKSNDGPISRLISELKNRSVLSKRSQLKLFTNGIMTGEEWQPRLPDSLCKIDFESKGVVAKGFTIDRRVPDEEIEVQSEVEFLRDLHAKIVVIEDNELSLAYFGSANFTRHGWGFFSGDRHANIETGVIVKAEKLVVQKLIPKTIGEAISLSAANVNKLAAPDTEPESVPWPDFIEAAILTPSTMNPDQLTLHVEVDLTKTQGEWGIELELESGRAVLESVSQNEHFYVYELNPEKLRRILQTQEIHVLWWKHPEGRSFPVNVVLEARPSLPIAPEYGVPKEQHLIAYYQGRILWEDLFPDPNPEPGATEKNPLAEVDAEGVDTSKIQSYIVREFVEALQGINDDLKLASQSTPGSMRLALLGAVSPLALAKHIYLACENGERTATATGFQLVEIMGCLLAAKNHKVSSQFSVDWDSLIAKSSSEVKTLLDKLCSRFPDELPFEFKNYVSEVESHHSGKVECQ